MGCFVVLLFCCFVDSQIASNQYEQQNHKTALPQRSEATVSAALPADSKTTITHANKANSGTIVPHHPVILLGRRV